MHHPFQNNQIQIKIGGDHGGNSFKMSYQLCNTNNPNSKENTVVFNIFEAKDRRSNLKMALSRNKEQIKQLQNMTWQYVYIYYDIVTFCYLIYIIIIVIYVMIPYLLLLDNVISWYFSLATTSFYVHHTD